ncbi:ABC transporter permease [Parvularcula lutaonensis]|uniref:ABC transporter permease n=1 Tax=Parvularcula lutaonensis TaxID=491923 RepID=A0ABV7MEU4_9PROT|nr:ABC transporter permease [Parvularcula lutaonensis]GGY55599.1 hypothetical protein GCM10007148_26870 [Parvularcula lutaonensis]
MRGIFEIVSHEYRRYIFTRGFLLFLLIIPVMSLLGASASFLQDATKAAKTFVLIDRDGGWADVVDEALEEQHQRAIIGRWDDFVMGLTASGLVDAEALEPPFAPGPVDAERREAFFAAGGLAEGRRRLAALTSMELPPLEEPRRDFRRIDPLVEIAPDADDQAIGTAYLPYMRGEKEIPGGGRLTAVVVIPEGYGAEDGPNAVYLTDNMADDELRAFLRGVFREKLRNDAFVARGLSVEDVAAINALSPGLSKVKAGSSAEDEAQRLRDTIEFGLPLGLTYILFFVVLSVGSMMLTNTIEEKSNKIVEMLLSSVSASQLMIGKLIGLALVGVTPMVIFAGLGFALISILGAGNEVLATLKEVMLASPLVPLFFFYFLLGYLLYASIYLAIGALCSSIQDAQSLSTPLTIIMLLPAPFIMSVIEDPNGLFARIFTWIPFYTHYALMLRLSGSPPLWEILGATAMLIVVVAMMLTFMGRIYRAGILQAGGNANWKTFFAAARAPKGEKVR